MMIKRYLLCVMILVAVLSVESRAQTSQRSRMDVEFCDFKVPKYLIQANATFPVVFKIRIGSDGKPMEVTKIRNNFLKDDAFIECIKGWTLPKDSELSVLFQWKHGEGWTDMAISGKELDYRIKFQQGAFSQYQSAR